MLEMWCLVILKTKRGEWVGYLYQTQQYVLHSCPQGLLSFCNSHEIKLFSHPNSV